MCILYCVVMSCIGVYTLMCTVQSIVPLWLNVTTDTYVPIGTTGPG